MSTSHCHAHLRGREINERSTVKCGNYWSGEKFGPLRLKLLEVSGAIEEYEKSDHRAPGEPFFPSVPKTPAAPPESSSGNGDSGSPQSSGTRGLELSHTSHRDASSSSNTLIGPTLTFPTTRAAYSSSSERSSAKLSVAWRIGPANHGKALVGLMTGVVAL